MRIAVTGAYGYAGRHIAARLAADGHEVVALTNHAPTDATLRTHALVPDADRMTAALAGCDALVNTYWVRFAMPGTDHPAAVRLSLELFTAARRAGVGRIVHTSITHADDADDLPYFQGKRLVEAGLRATGIAHSILRPAVFFGAGGILLNNIAWALRHLPAFAVFGHGAYRLQPIHVEDYAAVAVREATATGTRTIDAVGPESFSFRRLVDVVRSGLGLATPIIRLPPRLGWHACRLLSWWQDDALLTRDEITGLMRGLLHTGAAPQGERRVCDTVRAEAATLGLAYANECARRVVVSRC